MIVSERLGAGAWSVHFGNNNGILIDRRVKVEPNNGAGGGRGKKGDCNSVGNYVLYLQYVE